MSVDIANKTDKKIQTRIFQAFGISKTCKTSEKSNLSKNNQALN
jgi:hypothetical protein